MNKASKNPEALYMKSENQRLILNALKNNSASRTELADRSGLTRPCITFLVNDLIKRGLVRETVTRSTGVGRHPVMLEIVPDSRVVGGVNISRNCISVGFVNLGGRTLVSETIKNDDLSAVDGLTMIADMLLRQQAELKMPDERVIGIGVCAPGPLDYRTGQILNPPNFNAWHKLPVADILSRRTGFPVFLENVSGAMAICEWFFGRARGKDNFMVMPVNEGIGAGVVAGGTLYRGANGLGCEIGHSSIQYNGRKCACGNRGCLETYASIKSLLNKTPFSSWREVVDESETSPEAQALIVAEATYLSAAIVNAVNLFDLEHIILMGDVAYKPDALKRALEKNVLPCVIAQGNTSAPTIDFAVSDTPICVGAMACLYAFFLNEPHRNAI